MSNSPIALQHRFATDVPELAVPWRAAEVEHPRLLAFSDTLADELGVDAEALSSEEGLAFLTGNRLPEGVTPVAQGYSGHQWGMYTPRLGDGRALLLGEVTDRAGRLRDIHLKGSGATPFSRGADGLAAVGPMLREFIMGEAFHALGIPGTRALAVIGTGRLVRREGLEPGALLVRVASSHLRVGTFQYASASGNLEVLRRLADHAIERHAPEAAEAEHPYLAFYEHVVTAQAELVAAWMHVGFVHGVMSTDNTTVSGETIDFGPCAFLDAFDPGLWFSSIDQNGRYAYRQQPSIVQWNLARFAEALLPILPLTRDEAIAAAADADARADARERGDEAADDEGAESERRADAEARQIRAVELATAALERFGPQYAETYERGMRAKLGLAHVALDDARPVITGVLDLMTAARADYTQFFRGLGAHAASGRGTPARSLFPEPEAFERWAERWRALGPDREAMDAVNPAYIPRNHLVEEALAAASDEADLGPLERLLAAVRQPFDVRPGLARYAEPAPADFGPYTTFCGT
ncbi:UPF0061 protein [Pseudoclavibacter endophyticus]|nr:UPF0061 protein [Pseudoclavibacter endophyticus]